MADKVKLIQAQDFQLSGGGIGLTDTSITIDDFVLPNSNVPITMDMFGEIGYITLEPETDREENISFTDVINNGDSTSTITGVVRGLPLATTSDPADYNTPDLTLRQPHSGGSLLRITNSVSLLQWFASKANEETIEERWTFPSVAGVDRPILDADTDAVLNTELVTRGEVTRLIQANFISPSIVSSSSATTGTSTAASLNWNHVSLGDNRLILVAVATQEDVTVTGVTYNGDALIQAASHTRVTGNLRTEIWYRIAPDLGTNAIVVSTSGAAYISATALTLNDADQTTPIGDTSDADGSSTSPSVIVTTTQDNSLVVDSLATANDPITATAGAGQAIQQEVLSSATRQIVTSVELQPTAGNTTMSYTISPSTNWAITAVEIKGITVPGIAGVNSVTGNYIDNTDPANPVSEVPLNNTTNSAPTVNDDESIGYYVDSKWYDTSTGILYTCTDATNGAAVWVAVAGGVGSAERKVGVGEITDATIFNAQLQFIAELWSAPTNRVTNIYFSSGQDAVTLDGVFPGVDGGSSAGAFSDSRLFIVEAIVYLNNGNNVGAFGFNAAGDNSAITISNNIEGAYFVGDNSGNLYIQTGTGAARTQTNLGAIAGGREKLRIEFDRTIGTPAARFYRDGVLVGTITTNLPNSSEIGVTFQNGIGDVLIESAGCPSVAMEF